VSFFALDAQGCLSGRCEHFQHEGPEPHAHSVLFDGEGTYAYAVDLGNDILMRYDLTDSGVIMNPEQSLRVAPGSGPRTGLFHDHGRHLYVIHERASAVSHFVRGPEGYIQESMISTLLPDSGCEANACSDLHITPDGKFLYASNRLKGDGLAIFSQDAESGLLTWVGYQETGIHPRNFTLSPDGRFVLVACRDSDVIQVFIRDPRTGLLQDTGQDIHVPHPVFVTLTPTDRV
jgi:6-phosphogluconolactonase (cycloisomerase 2 family)